MEPFSLAAIFTLVAAVASGQDTPDPSGGTEHGLSDADLWQRIADGGDVLDGQTFEWAVQNDPRRVRALIDARIFADFVRSMNLAVLGDKTNDVGRKTFLLSMQALRDARGRVDADGMNAIAQETWGFYRQILDVTTKMRRPGTRAEAMWNAIAANREEISRMFRESQAIAEQAAAVAQADTERQAWLQMGAVLDDMDANLVSHLLAMNLMAEPPKIEGFGGYYPHYVDAMLGSGHRAPFEMPGNDLRRAGVRFAPSVMFDRNR